MVKLSINVFIHLNSRSLWTGFRYCPGGDLLRAGEESNLAIEVNLLTFPNDFLGLTKHSQKHDLLYM